MIKDGRKQAIYQAFRQALGIQDGVLQEGDGLLDAGGAVGYLMERHGMGRVKAIDCLLVSESAFDSHGRHVYIAENLDSAHESYLKGKKPDITVTDK